MSNPFPGITFGDIRIPPSQALPPAGFDQVAFRPACVQTVPVGQADGSIAWTLPMPDGLILTLLELPPSGEVEAYMTLDSYGLCKIGGDIVPVLYARQLPQRAVVAPVVQAMPATTAMAATTAVPQIEATPSGGSGLGSLLIGSAALLIMAAVVVNVSRKKESVEAGPAPVRNRPKGKPTARRGQIDSLLGGGK
jgi:hypothetical protein